VIRTGRAGRRGSDGIAGVLIGAGLALLALALLFAGFP
jgi:hypothetical protein